MLTKRPYLPADRLWGRLTVKWSTLKHLLPAVSFLRSGIFTPDFVSLTHYLSLIMSTFCLFSRWQSLCLSWLNGYTWRWATDEHGGEHRLGIHWPFWCGWARSCRDRLNSNGSEVPYQRVCPFSCPTPMPVLVYVLLFFDSQWMGWPLDHAHILSNYQVFFSLWESLGTLSLVQIPPWNVVSGRRRILQKHHRSLLRCYKKSNVHVRQGRSVN